MRKRLTGIAVLMIAGVLVACGVATDGGSQASAQGADGSPFAGIDRAVAVLHPTEGNEVRGVVRLRAQDDQVRVTATVRGLEPGSTHGFHIHQFGDCTAPDASSAGGHYNPTDHPHALPDSEPRHAGDFGNITVDDQGVARLDVTVDNITIAASENPVLGRGVIVHAQPDTGAQPSGEAGARIGCGVIGIAQSE